VIPFYLQCHTFHQSLLSLPMFDAFFCGQSTGRIIYGETYHPLFFAIINAISGEKTRAMNALELYKRLPRKNCGECRQKYCMPFALALIKGEAEVSECSYLSPEDVDELKKKIVHTDWREDLILRLREDIRDIDFSEVAPYIGAALKDKSLVLECMGREFMMDATGEVTTHGFLTPWMKILLLHYVKTGGRADAGGKWGSFSELKSGMVKASSFMRDCEEPLREMFDHGLQKMQSVLERSGAEDRDDFPTPYAWHMSLLPKIPVIILYWAADNEFASKVKVLFDSAADKFLDVESLIFLVEGLVYNIEASLSRTAQ